MHDQRVLFTVNSKSFEGTARIVDGLIVELTPHREHLEYH